MKKSFAMLAVTGLLTASLAYVAPAMAEESNEMPMEQTLADNSNANPGTSLPSSTDGTGSMRTSPNGDAPDTSNVGSSSNGSTTSTDEGSPDTATGDDDY